MFSPALLLLGLALVTPAYSASSPASLLSRADRFTSGSEHFTVEMKIANYIGDKLDSQHIYLVSQQSAGRTRVDFLSPQEKGQYLLILGDETWVHLPGTSRPMRISSLGRLTGGASNTDILRTRFGNEYEATSIRQDRLGTETCNVLSLQAKAKSSAYQHVVYWLRARDNMPLEADLFLASGKQIKTVTYDRYQPSGTRFSLTRMTIHEATAKDTRSVVEYSHYKVTQPANDLFLLTPERK